MRQTVLTVSAVVTAALLSACAGGGSPAGSLNPSVPTATTGGSVANPASRGGSAVNYAIYRDANGRFMPHWAQHATLIPKGMLPTSQQSFHGKHPPAGVGKGGIYVSELLGNNIYEFSHKNTGNNPPNCAITGDSFANDIASDGAGDILAPDGSSPSVQVYKADGTCGSQIGSVTESYGEPVDVTSANATTGTIAVANIFDNDFAAGSISLCTLGGGCTKNLTSSDIYLFASVAMAKNGDCWASGYSQSGKPALEYFQGCSGSGQAATGYNNTTFGGMDIDNHGNLLSIDSVAETATVYSGCNPACKVVSGPFTLQGFGIFGHFNHQAMTFAVADIGFGQVDVYKYANSTLTYWYSFNNGLQGYDGVEGVTYAPGSKE
ncbi:MAG TPA: hypothetical protein VGI19_03590 [Candidatus Cybelea sp.]|jgi:hypothetical protein